MKHCISCPNLRRKDGVRFVVGDGLRARHRSRDVVFSQSTYRGLNESNTADLLVWVPIVTLVGLVAVFFIVLAACLVKRQRSLTAMQSNVSLEMQNEEEGTVVSTKETSGQDQTDKTEDSSMVPSGEKRKVKLLRKLPVGLVDLLIRQKTSTERVDVPQEYKNIIEHWLKKYCDRDRTTDVEALEMFDLLSGLLDNTSTIKIAINLRDRGLASSALRILRSREFEEVEVQNLKRDLEKNGDQESVHAKESTIPFHEGKFWTGEELRSAVSTCYGSLKVVLRDSMEPSEGTSFGFSRKWPNALTTEEQQKYNALIDGTKTAGIEQSPIELDSLRPTEQQLSQSIIFLRCDFKLPLVRFVKVETILEMKILTRHEDLPQDDFTSKGKYALSFCWGSNLDADPSGDILKRLKRVLKALPQIHPGDGVYIDWCCFHLGDPLRFLVSKSIYQHCHVISLPTPKYFSDTWCMYEYFTWLLSPYPNQSICDYDLGPAASSLSLCFGRPPFLLDRPELGCFGYRCMASTDAFPPSDKALLMKKVLRDTSVSQTSLEELQTKIVFKLETSVIV